MFIEANIQNDPVSWCEFLLGQPLKQATNLLNKFLNAYNEPFFKLFFQLVFIH